MVVVFRRRRQSLGHAHRRHVAGRGEQAAGAVLRRGAGEDPRARVRSSSSFSAGRAGCSRRRAGRRSTRMATTSQHLSGQLRAVPAAPLAWRHGRAGACSRCSSSRSTLVSVLNLAVPASSSLHLSTYAVTLIGKYLTYALARGRGGSGVGLLRHPEPRACGLLRARRLRDGHVPHAADRRARRVRQPGAAGLHGVPELQGAAVVLARVRHVLVRHAHGDSSCRACWRSCSDGLRSGRV